MTRPDIAVNRRRLLLISQAYIPDYAAVGRHFADLTEKFASDGWDVEVLTSRRRYSSPEKLLPRTEKIGNVSIKRLLTPCYEKSDLRSSIFAQLVFILKATFRALLSTNYDVIVVSTSPPFAATAGVTIQAVTGTPFVWWVMDLNPDQIVAAGLKHKRSLSVRAFDILNKIVLTRAAAVIALDGYMKQRLLKKCPLATNISVIPPWPHNEPREASDNESRQRRHENDFRLKHSWTNRFVVMYSGNHGRQHPLETLLAVTKEASISQQILFAFIGDGDGKKAIDDAIASGAENIVSLPYQPLSTLPQSLGAADIHVVCMSDNIAGIIHPCKIYGAMVAGKPILFFGPRESHIGDLIDTHGFGWRVDHGDVRAAAAVIASAAKLPTTELTRMGRVASKVARDLFSRRTLLDKIHQTVTGGCTQ